MKTVEPYKILFLCTGNSARSIIGEFLIRRIAPNRFQSFSAGTQPTGRVNPYALRVLDEVYHIDASGARSKHTDEFANIDFDFVITVCDNARESCPICPVSRLSHIGEFQILRSLKGPTKRFFANSKVSRECSIVASNCSAACHLRNLIDSSWSR